MHDYVPYGELGGRPNVIVDGAATEGTVLTLSHWPHTPTPPDVARDLSAEMVFAYLDRPDLQQPGAAVSNNHFDQDGLVSVFALVDPDAARARRDFLEAVAAAGDFAIYRDRNAARASMAIAALDTDYDAMLDRVVDLCDDVDRYRDAWAAEDETLAASEALIERGAVRIDEVESLELAFVTMPAEAPDAGGHRFARLWHTGLHPMAINNATSAMAIVTVHGRAYELTYRYETWVQYRSRQLRPRVDLQPLALALNDRETSGGEWHADPPSALEPRLRLEGADGSSLEVQEFRALVEAHLRAAPPAWDPYAT